MCTIDITIDTTDSFGRELPVLPIGLIVEKLSIYFATIGTTDISVFFHIFPDFLSILRKNERIFSEIFGFS